MGQRVRVVERGLEVGRVAAHGALVSRAAGSYRARIVEVIDLFGGGRPMGSFQLGSQLFAGPPRLDTEEIVG